MKNKRRTILLNVLTILLCIATCVGVTFAFFADSAISSNNKVQAGTLNVDLKLLEKNTTDKWNSIKKDHTPVFSEDIHWEPGYTDVKILKVENNGNLAIKWEAKIILRGELTALAEVINVYLHPFAEGEAVEYPQNRRALEAWDTPITLNNYVDANAKTFKSFLLSGTLTPKQSTSFAIALQMKSESGNEYQGLELGNFDIQIVATQTTHENDFFNNQYDVEACLHSQTKYEAVAATSTKKGEVRIRCANTKCNALVETQDMYFMFSGPRKGYYTITGVSGAYPSEELIVPSTYCGLPVKAIEKYAFSGSTKFTSVIISEGITTLGNSLFHKCSALKFVSIPSSVTSLGDSVFNECPVLETVVFGADIQIEELNMTFNYCSELKNVIIPESVKTIGQYAFRGCTNLKSINIPDNVEIIGEGAFIDCGLETIEFGETTKLTSIGSRAFSNTTVQNFTVPDGVTTIGDYAFEYAKFTKITIPATVTRTGTKIFMHSISLQKVYFMGTVAQWMAINKGSNDDWNQWFAFYVQCTDGIIYEDTRHHEKDAVTFDGTVAQWLEMTASIQLPFRYEITCTDGKIAKDGTITMK